MNKLHTSSDDRIIAGVCGGIGETYGIDPSLVRILFVLLTLFYGSGLLIYIVLMIVLPSAHHMEEDKNIEKKEPKKLYRVREGKMIAGVCTGLGDLLKIDVSLLRIAFVLITIFSSGTPVLLYLLFWMILPYKD